MERRDTARERHVYRPLLVVVCAAVGVLATGVMVLAGGRLGEDVSCRLYDRFERGPDWLTYPDRSYEGTCNEAAPYDDSGEYVDEGYVDDGFVDEAYVDQEYVGGGNVDDEDPDEEVDPGPSRVAVAVTGEADEVTVTLTWTGRPTHPVFRESSRQADLVTIDDLALVDVYPSDQGGRESVEPSVKDGVAKVVFKRVVPVRDDESIDVYVSPNLDAPGMPSIGPVSVTAGSNRRLVAYAVDEGPTSLSATSVTWSRLDSDGSSAEAGLALPAPSEARSWGSFLVDWGHQKHPRWLWTTAYELLALLPFIAGSLLSRRVPLRDRTAHRAGVVAFDMLLLLRALPALLLGLNEMLQLLDGPLAGPAQEVRDRFGWPEVYLDQFGGRGATEVVVGFVAGAGWIALLCAFVVGWPLVVTGAWRSVQAKRPLRPRGRVPWTWVVLSGAVAVGVATAGEVSGYGDDGVVLAAAGLVLAWMAAGMARGVGQPGLSAALGVPAVVVLTIALQYFTLLPNSLDETISVVSGAIVSAVVVLVFVGAMVVLVRAYFPEVFQRGLHRLRTTPLLAAAAIALLTVTAGYLVVPRDPGRQIPLNAFDVVELGIQLREYLPFLLFAAIVCELHRACDARADAKPWGVLLMVAVLFEPTASFWILPIVGLLGAGGMVVLLGRRPTHPEVHASLGVRAKRLATLFSVRRDEKVASRAEAAAREKAATGEVDLDEAMGTALKIRASIEQRLEDAGVVSIEELDHAATALGPGKDEWESGWIGALCSVVLGLPWIVLYAGRVLDDAVDTGYVGLTLGRSLLAVAVDWIAIGFVLGYFHAYVRGRTAVWKGLSVGIVVVVPWLVHAATYRIPAGEQSWRSFALWAGQMLIHCVVVGVALEWVLVRRTVGSSGVLIELRSFRPVVTYASGLVAALGATVVTVATGTLNHVLAAGAASLVGDNDTPTVETNLGHGTATDGGGAAGDAIRILWPPELERPG